MKKTILLLFVICMALPCFAQDKAAKTSTESGRWEIIQSPIGRRYTFKLDKFTGDTYLMVQAEDDRITWQKIDRLGESLDENDNSIINFQLFLSGIAIKDSFLINIHTGRTWQLYQDTDDSIYWHLLF